MLQFNILKIYHSTKEIEIRDATVPSIIPISDERISFQGRLWSGKQ